MAYGYKSGDRQQLSLLPPSMDEWLEEDHLAYFVIDTVELIDTTAFHEIHPEGPGRPAYEPEMMLGLLLYAYATGLRSSRKIMAACRSDLAYKVIAVNLVPDHRTIARFRAENEGSTRRDRLCSAGVSHREGIPVRQAELPMPWGPPTT